MTNHHKRGIYFIKEKILLFLLCVLTEVIIRIIVPPVKNDLVWCDIY